MFQIWGELKELCEGPRAGSLILHKTVNSYGTI